MNSFLNISYYNLEWQNPLMKLNQTRRAQPLHCFLFNIHFSVVIFLAFSISHDTSSWEWKFTFIFNLVTAWLSNRRESNNRADSKSTLSQKMSLFCNLSYLVSTNLHCSNLVFLHISIPLLNSSISLLSGLIIRKK